MEDSVALHCLFLLGTDTWAKWQQRSKVQWRPTRFQSQATRDDVPEGSESRLGGITEPRRWAFRISRHADGTALSWSARWRKVPES